MTKVQPKSKSTDKKVVATSNKKVATKASVKSTAKNAVKPAANVKDPDKKVAKSDLKEHSKSISKSQNADIKAVGKKNIKATVTKVESISVKNDTKIKAGSTTTVKTDAKKTEVEVKEKISSKSDVNDAKLTEIHILTKSDDFFGEIDDKLEISITKKLMALFTLQQIDSQIDKIRIVRGELPLEVQDLEDEIEGLTTRINNLKEEVVELDAQITERNQAIITSQGLIKKYESQQDNVRNNREFDSLKKEVEYQTLEIQLSEKRLKEFAVKLEAKQESIAQAEEVLNEKQDDLNEKLGELKEIITETEKEEQELMARSAEAHLAIEERLLYAYTRIRKNVRNGLAVVKVERDACGGCFSKIPPQRQLEIRFHKKIIVCEYCGRILVDESIANKDSN